MEPESLAIRTNAEEQRERLLARIAFEATWERDLRTNHVNWSTGLEMFGYPHDEVGDRLSWWRERVHPDDLDNTWKQVEQAIESNASGWSAEYRFRRRDGSWAWVTSRCAIDRDDQGRPVRAVGAMIDVSRLKEAEERLRLVAEQIPVRIGVIDPDLRIRWDLGAGFGKIGSSAGRTLAEAFAKSPDRERVLDANRRALAGEPGTLRVAIGDREAELQLEPLREISGEIVGVVGVALDITERARTEDVLQETRRILLEAQRIGQVRAWEEDLRTGMVKSDLATLLGPAVAPQGVTTNEQAWNLIHPDDRARLLELRRRTIEMGGPFETEYRMTPPDGGERNILIRGELVRDANGKPERILGTALDITERREAELALEKSEHLLRNAEALGHTGSWEWDLRGEEIICSDENRRIFFGDDLSKGFKLADYVARYHPDDHQWLMEEQRKLLTGGRPRGEIEFRIVRPDGNVRWILGRSQVIRNEQGRPVRAFGSNTDISERKLVEEKLSRHARQQASIAQLSLIALRGDSLQPIFEEAVRLITSTLGVDYSVVLEWMPEKVAMEFRAGAGPWCEDLLRSITVSTSPGFMAWFYLRSKVPVVVEDFPRETRFAPCELLVKHGIRSAIAIPVAGKERPYGVLEANSRSVRAFSDDEVNFVWAMANVLATAIEQRRVASELGDKREQMQALSRKLIQAQEAERRAVARELHDELGQILTAIRLNVARPRPGQAETVSLVDGAIARVRELAQDLRPPLLDELGLEASLRWYVEREARRAGLEVKLALTPMEQRPPPSVETTSFRVAQEALTNVIRHAQARHVEIELSRVGCALQLIVRDDGRGFDVPAARRRAAQGGSQGLLGMQERVALAAGELSIESAQGHGTTVRARLPLTSINGTSLPVAGHASR